MDVARAPRSEGTAEQRSVSRAGNAGVVGARKDAEVERTPAGPAIERFGVNAEERQ
jgi:hypothetical protein